jgi:phosphoribosylanthranilate isomerase
MSLVKICGLTQEADALAAAGFGADMLGFIMTPVSKRYIQPSHVRPIIETLRGQLGAFCPVCVGVFVTEDTTPSAIMTDCETAGVDAIQIVGLQDPQWLTELPLPAYVCIRPTTPAEAHSAATLFERPDLPEPLPTLQVDTFHPALYGGTGETTPEGVALVLSYRIKRLMLSGGLTPDNVGDYVRRYNPWAVDVASGTEAAPGRKDLDKLQRFITTAKQGVINP